LISYLQKLGKSEIVPEKAAPAEAKTHAPATLAKAAQ
jgi:hypothetical protein